MVSAASGAVGAVVGQIGKINGCNVIGIAGSTEKCDYVVNDLGFDASINYKTENVSDQLALLGPNGIDAYFDNVGGIVSEAVMDRINIGARIAICGQISQYILKTPDMAPRSLGLLTRSQAKMEGFLVFAYESRYEDGITRMGRCQIS